MNLDSSTLDVDDPNLSLNYTISPVSDENIAFTKAPSYAQHAFREWPADATSTINAFYSNRTIIATSNCSVFNVVVDLAAQALMPSRIRDKRASIMSAKSTSATSPMQQFPPLKFLTALLSWLLAPLRSKVTSHRTDQVNLSDIQPGSETESGRTEV